MDERSPPKVDNAPGLVWRGRKSEWVATWQPRTDLVERGYPGGTVEIWRGNDPSDIEKQFISDQCTMKQNAMLVWGRGGLEASAVFDGTMRSLMDCYKTDKLSPYKKVRYQSRLYYDALMKRIEADHGDDLVSDIDARKLIEMHEKWTERGVSMAHSLVGMMRTLTKFGSLFLKSAACKELKSTLSEMDFPMAPPRGVMLTAEQAQAIISIAHRTGRHSVALAQAFQFECMFRQKDILGEWIPIEEPGVSDETWQGMKWLCGIRWEEIDEFLILRHITSKRQKLIEVDLKLAPMVMAELRRLAKSETITRDMFPASGPIIISEYTGRPWFAQDFRYRWRKDATLAGVPKSIRNMDSRAGAITEATESGAELEHIKQAATHGDISMTQRYARNQRGKTDNVMQLRTAHRNKSGTK